MLINKDKIVFSVKRNETRIRDGRRIRIRIRNGTGNADN